MDKFALFKEVKNSIEGYQKFLKQNNFDEAQKWTDIPICNKKNYMLKYPIEKLCRQELFKKCSLIGASSGFSKEGSVLWLKQADDEKAYINAVKQLLISNYSIDSKSTLIIVSLALGTWIGGMQLACTFRKLASEMDNVIIATPGMDLKEAVHIAKRFGYLYKQILWITNPSNINIIYSLILDDKELLEGKIYFPVVGEYFSENFREKIAKKFGHNKENPFVVKTGYGSADTGDLGIETEDTIKLRKYLNNNKSISQKLFNDEAPPMMFVKNPKAFIEVINNDLIVTKDQFVPLIRYNTHDNGGLIKKLKLKEAGIKEDILQNLPDEILYVFGRNSNDIVFYGTNLNVTQIEEFLNSLNDSFSYGGLFEIETKEKDGIEFFEFTIYLLDKKDSLQKQYQDSLIEFLKASSNEFAAKYDKLYSAVQEDLIKVKLDFIKNKNIEKKHHTIIER